LNVSNAGSSATCSLQIPRAGVIRCTQEKLRMEKEEKMKVRVDEETCVGDETCVQVCPEIFEMNGDVAVAKMEEVPKDLEGKCKEAAEACPVEAILIE
jgi:ferredoxin